MGSLLTPADLDSLKRENGTFDWPKLMRLQRGGDWDPKKHDPCDLLKHGDLDNEGFWNGEFGCGAPIFAWICRKKSCVFESIQ